MRFITTRVHGILDYLVGFFLVLAPRMFGFAAGSAEEKVLILLGVTVLVYSLGTRYELGLFKLLPFRVHLNFDYVHGALLAASPWLFGFSDRVWMPHLVLGLFEIVVASATVPQPTGDPLGRLR